MQYKNKATECDNSKSYDSITELAHGNFIMVFYFKQLSSSILQ